ncbi:hypothetical protein DFH08DRAFT_834284 [Mycena albidolilacea]|uniref:Secreted protein n=1 Tax=Mycena albidolilacea TaxID=1033008 RepID=A0AAD7F2I5_9AGAR|nr:hypothetical protein DFH08DRAFT_834284 [Mycena albidolilacea]
MFIVFKLPALLLQLSPAQAPSTSNPPIVSRLFHVNPVSPPPRLRSQSCLATFSKVLGQPSSSGVISPNSPCNKHL